MIAAGSLTAFFTVSKVINWKRLHGWVPTKLWRVVAQYNGLIRHEKVKQIYMRARHIMGGIMSILTYFLYREA